MNSKKIQPNLLQEVKTASAEHDLLPVFVKVNGNGKRFKNEIEKYRLEGRAGQLTGIFSANLSISEVKELSDKSWVVTMSLSGIMVPF